MSRPNKLVVDSAALVVTRCGLQSPLLRGDSGVCFFRHRLKNTPRPAVGGAPLSRGEKRHELTVV